MKLILVSAFLLVSLQLQANELFWKDVALGKTSEWNGKHFVLMGELASKKRVVRARDNYWKLQIKDPGSSKYIDIKIYTIVKLKRINTIECEVGEMMSLSGKLQVAQNKGDQVGSLLIKNVDDKLECHKKKIEEKEEK